MVLALSQAVDALAGGWSGQDLTGIALPSTNAANSELTAQTLTFSDLQNQMDYSASSGSISGGAGGQMYSGK